MTGAITRVGQGTQFPILRTSIAIVLALALAGTLTGCDASDSRGGDPIEPGKGPGGSNTDPVAEMFLRNREKLQAPSEALRASIDMSLAGFTTPLSGSSQEISIDLRISNKSGDRELVVLAMIPYQVGDVVSGPGARFHVISSRSFPLRPLEVQSVTIDVIRERVAGGAPQQPPVGGSSMPQALEAQQEGGVSPLDSALGLQVLLIVQFVGEVRADSWQRIEVVPDGEFAARYGSFAAYQYGIGVPIERIA